MKLAVFGATGRTGGAFIRQALADGHAITALVRNPEASLPDGVAITIGDVLDAAAVESFVRRDDVIVVTLGRVDALTIGCANIVRAAASAGARRLLGVVGAGVLQADATRRRSELPDYPPALRVIGAAHRAFCDALEASALDWTLACTPRLVDGPRTDAFRATSSFLPEGTGSITTEDVASFLLREAIEARHVRERVGLNGTR
ncbi:MAG TPA: NAD(P)H-binding protein [Labilithrix sp.]|jgi:putative NADH-flavin reductase